MSWKTASLKDFGCTVFDGPHATPKDADTGHIFLGIRNVSEHGSLDLSDPKYISDEEFPKWTKRVKPEKNDVVFSYEATLHRYAIIPEGFDGCLGRRMGLVRVDEEQLEPRYLLYYFLSPLWRAYADTKVIIGATVNRLPIKDFPGFHVSAPDLLTQQRIVDVIATYDDLIENNRRRIQLLEESARLLYQEWFVHLRFPGHEQVKIADGVPEGWEKKPISSFGRVITGKTPSTKNDAYYGDDVPFIKTPDMHGNVFVVSTSQSLSESGSKSQQSTLLPSGCIMVSCIGTVGVVSINPLEAHTNQQINSVIPENKYFVEFLFCGLKKIKPMLEAIGASSTMNNVNKSKFSSLELLMPSEKLITEFHFSVASTFDLILSLQKQNLALAKARDLLLPKLLSGELTV
jgi:Restriction endonuclease S subunits